MIFPGLPMQKKSIVLVILTCIMRPMQCWPIQSRGPYPNVNTRHLAGASLKEKQMASNYLVIYRHFEFIDIKTTSIITLLPTVQARISLVL